MLNWPSRWYIPDRFFESFTAPKPASSNSKETRFRPLGQNSISVTIFHINIVGFKEGGYSLNLSGGERIGDDESGFKLNEWVHAIIEFKDGELLIELNGRRKRIKHEQVSMKGRNEISFRALESPNSRLLFDYVRIWSAE